MFLYIYVIYVSCFEHECVWNLLYIVFGCNIYINSCMSNKLYKQHFKMIAKMNLIDVAFN